VPEKFFCLVPVPVLVPGEKFCLLQVPVLVPGKKSGAAASLLKSGPLTQNFLCEFSGTLVKSTFVTNFGRRKVIFITLNLTKRVNLAGNSELWAR
jgi:hypothetical protein